MWKQVVVALMVFELVFAGMFLAAKGWPDTIAWVANVAFAAWLAMEALRVRLGHGAGESQTFGLLSRLFLIASFTSVAVAFLDKAMQLQVLQIDTDMAYWLSALGAILLAGGVYLRHVSISTLGKFFVTKVQITSDHQLISDGIYGFLRHPSYTGLILGFIGTVLLLQSLVALAFFLLVALPAYVYRIRVEETALKSVFGSQYDEYRENTSAIIPYIY
jgi:protein-S-isoprenylcysteine O-methyltransferase